jgi:WD40 repeat protein
MMELPRIRLRPVLLILLLLMVLGLMGAFDPFLSNGCRDESGAVILGKHRFSIHCLAFAPDGKALASGGGFPGRKGEIRLWNVPSGALRATLRSHQKCVYAATFSPDGGTVATTSYDGMVKLWDVTSARERASITISAELSGLPLAFSPAGDSLALAGCRPGLPVPGCEAGDVMLWRRTPRSKPARARGMVPLALGAAIRRLALCRVDLGTELPGADADSAQPNRPDQCGGLLAEGTWDVTIGQQTCTLTGHEDFVYGLAFSPDGRVLASASLDNTVRFWDVATGQRRAILHGHTAQVNSVSFSPDGKRLTSGSHDRSVRLWDTATGRELATFRGHEGAVTCVACSPDGRWVASGRYDKTVRLWQLPTDR